MSFAKLMAALCALVAGMALNVSSASAAGWMVGGSELSGSEAVATTAAAMENAKGEASGVTVECAGATTNAVSPKLEAPNKASASSIVFTGCESKTAGCKTAKTEIGTVPVTVEATLEGATKVRAVGRPVTGKIFTTIKYEGAECALAGVKPVTGQVTATSSADEEVLESLVLILITEASGELKEGSSSAYLHIHVLVRLASGRAWNYL
ncbi:MAG TPA: hypothetical protein VMU32_03030 [Solirubrobacteraceae bacterium]|nr:hypothetical protein [Solirubrobacteraceae bacterium]